MIKIHTITKPDFTITKKKQVVGAIVDGKLMKAKKDHKLLELLEVVEHIPEGYKRLFGALIHPQGYDIIYNDNKDLKLLKLNTGDEEK